MSNELEIESFELEEEFNESQRIYYIMSMSYEDFKELLKKRNKNDNNYKNEEERKNIYNSTIKYCKETLSNNLKNKVIWTKSKGGRYYSKNSLQNYPREIKDFLTEDIMTDIDINNSQPTILLNICKKYDIKCTELEYYCNNRTEMLKKTNLHKRLFITSINYNKRILNIKNTLFNDYDKEIKNIQKELLKIDELKEIIDEIKEENKENIEKGEDINLEGKLINRIYFNFESQIIILLKSLLEKMGYKISIYSYDGLMIYGNHYDNIDLLDHLNKSLNEEIKFNYPIKIMFKRPEKSIIIPDNWVNKIETFEMNDKEQTDNTCKRAYYFTKILRTEGENDYAKFFTYLYGHKFVYVCENIYYSFNERKIWQLDNDGTTIRKMLSNDFYEEFMIYQQHFKKLCVTKNMTEEEIEEYKKKISKIEILSKRLKKTTDKNNILKEIKDEIKDIEFEEDMNREKYLLPISNGKMLNMKTLEVFERTIKNKFNYECNANYVEMTEYENNEMMKYFMDLFCNNEEMVYTVLDMLKSIFSGLKLRYIFFFTGCGSNGKSLLFKLLKNIFKDAMDTISTDIIIEKKNKSSITTEYEKLDKCRLGYVTELNENHKLNVDIIKKISGGDEIDLRGLYKTNYTINPTANLCVLTNELPNFPKKQAMIDRIIIIPFNNRFEVNINFEEDMMKKKDLIFSFIMNKGTIKDKFDLTEEMQKSKNEYVENNTIDPLKDYIEETYSKKNYVKTEKVLRDDFRMRYDEYCNRKKLSINNDSNNKFTKDLYKKYNIESKDSHGKTFYIGLVLKSETNEEPEEE